MAMGGWLARLSKKLSAGVQSGPSGHKSKPGKPARLMIIEDRRRKKTNKIDFNLSMWDTANWLTQTKTDKEIYRQL